jgi:hypothetical protein
MGNGLVLVAAMLPYLLTNYENRFLHTAGKSPWVWQKAFILRSASAMNCLIQCEYRTKGTLLRHVPSLSTQVKKVREPLFASVLKAMLHT